MYNEHGLSLYIEANGSRIIFDLGQTSNFSHNAKHLNVDISAIDLAIISHGHYDHGGGLPCFMELNRNAPVYLRHGADGLYYVNRHNLEYIGLNQEILSSNNHRLIWLERNEEIAPGIHLITCIPQCEPQPLGNSGLSMRKNDEIIQDDFTHELFCIIEEEDGITLITGCGHSGISNMMIAAKDQFPSHELKAVIGGLHLTDGDGINNPVIDEEAIGSLFKKLSEWGNARLITGHCTGDKTINLLSEKLGKRLIRMSTGMDIML